MKISVNPLPAAKASAVDQINGRFAAATNPHRDQAHRRKREIAASILSGSEPTAEFEAEAAMRGMDVKAFATLIAAKPNAIDARELARQKLLFAIDAAKSPAEIAAILAG